MSEEKEFPSDSNFETSGEANVEFLIESESIKNIEYKQCMLCMDEINPSHEILKLECNHIYHMSCVLNWINAQVNAGVDPRCPYCKKITF